MTQAPIKEKNDIIRYTPEISFGLNNSQLSERKESGLINVAGKKYSKSYFSIFCGNIFTFFNFLGLVVFIALIAVGAKLFDFVFVLVFLANLSIGIIQEIRAKICIDRLSLVTAKSVKVIRNGNETDVSVKEIVLDDIIKLGIGNQIPTDCKIMDGMVEVNESLLTGESVPVKKHIGDELLSGSFIVSGVCIAQAVKVGKENYVEQLSAKAKKYRKPHSELMTSLKIIIKTVGLIIVPLGTLFFLKSYIGLKADLPSSVLSASTVVIGMIPSGMFLLTSLALAVGTIKLARHNTLVQDLYSLEMLARVDTICFDKTGTITDGRMSLKEVVPLSETEYPINTIVSSMLGTLKDNNQTAIALYNYFGQNVAFKATATLPFNSIRKLSAVTFEKIGTFSFGAPEFVLSENNYRELEPLINQYASMGLRVLLLAKSEQELSENAIPNDFIPISLLLIVDNVREDAIDTIKWFKENDVAIKVISGDNPITVAEVSKRVGIENAENYISLEGLSDNDVMEAANKYTVFGRVSPEQKAILIKAIKNAGHVTAMTGDGVNDIIALKEADCAISVASGSEAARNVAHLVLTDNNFNSMPKVVFEGRRVINNIQRSASLYLMKTLFTMILSVITLCLPFIEVYPFTLKQMNLLEIFVIGIPSFFLSMQPNKARVEGKFISYVICKSLPSALLMVFSVGLVGLAKYSLGSFPSEIYSTMGVFALTYAGIISLFLICKPLNLYRAILFTVSIFGVSVVCLITIVFGLNALSLSIMSPLNEYWHHILIVLCIILLDIPLANYLQRLCAFLLSDRIWDKKKIHLFAKKNK